MTLRQWAGVALVGLAMFVILTTFPLRYSHRILVPGLVPVFGIPFLLVFLAGQVGLCFALKARKGLYWLLGGLVVGVPLALVGHSVRSYLPATQTLEFWPRNGLCTAVCLSAIALGFALAKAKV